jgi:N-acetylneuraminic acid mutarotase
MRSRNRTCLHLEALEDRCLLSFDPALLGSVGLVAESAAVSDFDNGSNRDLASASSVSLAAAQSSQDCHLLGSWTPAASMAEPRAFYSATLLDDGRVLVAGGFVRTNGIGPPLGGHYSAGTEIYDPTSDTWSPTNHLLTGRAGHAAVLLEDGRVLVAGGQMVVAPGTPPVTLASAEIYDPAAGAWTATGSMHVRRAEPILTLLPDGRVFVSGAARAAGPDATSAEIYDPATGAWTRVADMSTPRSDHIQELLDDGRVLVAGGFSGTVRAPSAYFASAEIYDPVSNTWTPTGSMTMPRADAEGVRLENGQVMAVGGNTAISVPATRTNTAEIYDPTTGQWRLTGGAMSDPKVDHAVTLLKDGQVLVAGGIRTNDTEVASADLYNPSTDIWTPEPSMARARGGIFAVTLVDGRVLVVGGENEDPNTLPDNALASAELFTEPPARVESVVLNDGSARRSMVNSLTVTFDQVVILDPGAFELDREGGGSIDVLVSTSVVSGKTVAVLTFAGPDVVAGSLADGRYTLTLRADRVRDRLGRELDGDCDGTPGGNRVDNFFRLFGDSDGDGDVDWLDRDRFRSAFKSMSGDVNYLWYFDFDGDGDVDGRDNGQFNRRFGQS